MFCVHIFGMVPNEIEVEAKDRAEACEKALMDCCERLSFKAMPIEEPVAEKEAK